ncbi:interleukin-31 receptor subunit alpha [Austrofundulus limnaeus]|uniref:Interleukin-31 receptor subunit alpha n=1 Tax=Austrofundulus limnaeus TaxID=52670 RepID=A0A2I4CK58_AUSLI|nr:PREDICTED: interleukin-31 receptor subunit alpha-like [Austrofundulus limnaeus]
MVGSMSGRGVQLMFGSHSQDLIFGLVLVFYTTLSSHMRASAEHCRSKNTSVEYQHCGFHPDGVHDLVCFGKPNQSVKNCTWKPGKHTSKNTGTKATCYIFNNITTFHLNTRKVFENYDTIIVEVFENAHTGNCTKAVFQGSPKHLLRCDAPSSASFSRPAGGLNVTVTWNQSEETMIKSFSVRLRKVGSSSWNESSVPSESRTKLRVEHLNSSLMYVVQIQCDTNDKCSQCPWSEDHIVPSELTSQPIINSLEETADQPGRRWISVNWRFPAESDGYKVTIWKASGEVPQEQKKTIKAKIRLLLSHSEYLLNISAFNNASISPPVSLRIPQKEDVMNEGDGRLNVSVNNSTALTVSWKDDLIKQFVCYSVEWRKKGHSALYKSFYENTNNYRHLSHLPVPLEPYIRYSLTLHTRPYKDTCNIKHINNSESTYGTTQFYFKQGSPVSAPTNISFSNKTLTSVVLRWSSVPEEDVRGFLLGYIIHWTEHHHLGTENNITLNHKFNSWELKNLKSGTVHQVQISAFTSAGEGVRSAASFFKTHHDEKTNLIALIAVCVVAVLLVPGCHVIHRLKATIWPSIPNPGNSNAVQKMDKPSQLELLKAMATLQVEEWDTKSLQILEREDSIPAGTLPSTLPLLRTSSADKQDSPEMSCNWIQSDTDSTAVDNPPDNTTVTLLETQRTDLQSSPLTFGGDYMTMELFQKLICQDEEPDATVTAVTEDNSDNMMVKALRLDYVRQFSTRPPDSEHVSTCL